MSIKKSKRFDLGFLLFSDRTGSAMNASVCTRRFDLSSLRASARLRG